MLQISFPLWLVFFILLMISFDKHKLLILIETNLFINFFLYCYCFLCFIEEISCCPQIMKRFF